MKAKKEHGLGLIFVSRLPSIAPGLQPSPQSALPLLGRASRYWLLFQVLSQNQIACPLPRVVAQRLWVVSVVCPQVGGVGEVQRGGRMIGVGVAIGKATVWGATVAGRRSRGLGWVCKVGSGCTPGRRLDCGPQSRAACSWGRWKHKREGVMLVPTVCMWGARGLLAGCPGDVGHLPGSWGGEQESDAE